MRGWAKTLRGAAPAALFFAAASIVMTFPLVLHLILIRLIESHPHLWDKLTDELKRELPKE